MRFASFRRALLPALAAALLGGAAAAGAQRVTAAYAPSCGPTTSCSLLRFQVENYGTSSLLLNTLTLTGTSAAFRFAPAAGGVALYQAVDAVGPFGGSGTVAPGGTPLFINFLGGNGFSFELAPSSFGYVEVALAQVPAVVDGAFTFSAAVNGGAAIAGSVAVIPEPTTVALLGGGLALVGIGARRRRRAE